MTGALGWSMVGAGGAESTLTGEQARQRMEAAELEVATVRSNIFLTLVQLDRVRGERDPQHPQFQAFTNQLGVMQGLAKALGKRAQEMEQKGDAYFGDWEARLQSIQSAEARQRAQQRYGERKQCYDTIKSNMQDAKKNFLPFVEELTEIQAVLQAGQDPKSVARAKHLLMKANWHCIDVQRALLNVEDQFEQLAASFAKDE